MTREVYNPGGCVDCEECRIAPRDCPQCQRTVYICNECEREIPDGEHICAECAAKLEESEDDDGEF